jgi:hypothetical protein
MGAIEKLVRKVGLGAIVAGLMLLALLAVGPIGGNSAPARARDDRASRPDRHHRDDELAAAPETLVAARTPMDYDTCVSTVGTTAEEYPRACNHAKDACMARCAPPSAECAASCESTRLRCAEDVRRWLTDKQVRCSTQAQLGAGLVRAVGNEYCVGQRDQATWNPLADGQGAICAKAVGQPSCGNATALGSLYCACCHCYAPCGMSRTAWANCAKQFGGSAHAPGRCGTS